jgi:hypothetical protein
VPDTIVNSLEALLYTCAKELFAFDLKLRNHFREFKMAASASKLFSLASTGLLSLAFLGLALAPTPAWAAHHHHRIHHSIHHGAHYAPGSAVIRIAQRHLLNLGFYSGSIDGIMGPRTRAAIKKFQRAHGLKIDGVVGPITSRMLDQADPNGFGGIHGTVSGNDAVGATVNNDYAQGMNDGTRALSSRFARVDVVESGVGADKRYNISLNGQPMLVADGQPSVVGISPTYDLGNEDAVIFTTFSPNESGCTYRNHVLALTGEGSKLLDLESCTRSFDAVAKNGSLFINFPQKDSNSAVGSTWRLEGYTLTRL